MTLHPNTLVLHAGQGVDAYTGAVVPPIVLATTFERDPDGGYSRGHQYSRKSNPTRNQLESCFAALEGGSDAAAFSSGVAAAAAILQALDPGDHILVADDLYHGNRYLMLQHLQRWGLQVSFADMSDLKAVEARLLSNTKLVWAETPSNPLMKLCDIAALSSLTKTKKALLVVDNTFATPLLQRVFDLGADIALHATTKYLSGHSDVLGGAVITKENSAFFDRIRDNQQAYGGVPSPFDCYMSLRGIKTLACRMHFHSKNAMAVAQFLESHAEVETVFYPGLESHPQHALAKKQMSDFGGMLSFLVKGSEEKARNVANSTALFAQATSLGGVESLIEHRASVEPPTTSTPRNLIRVSVGIEHISDLINDLAHALAR